ncbi:hypothetical protein E2C01_038646 [Portunus trituberculatus]|uniref:Uncharacterized protein n=1 Tax=Portunus trituberculatus TaxID=210409 RepID=A0A5B7FKM4_PORTR|nr:hypothetical protein [Portunus trituberculatus]
MHHIKKYTFIPIIIFLLEGEGMVSDFLRAPANLGPRLLLTHEREPADGGGGIGSSSSPSGSCPSAQVLRSGGSEVIALFCFLMV